MKRLDIGELDLGVVEQAAAADVGQGLAGGADEDDGAVGIGGAVAGGGVGGVADDLGVAVADAVAAGGAAGGGIRRIDDVEGVEAVDAAGDQGQQQILDKAALVEGREETIQMPKRPALYG